MNKQDQGGPPWVAIFSGLVALIVFLLALDQGLAQAAVMGIAAFMIVFMPLGLLALALERWRL